MARSRDQLTAELQGGVGNQLFVLAAGLAQALRLGVPLQLETGRLNLTSSRHVRRELEISTLLPHLDYPVSLIQTPHTAVSALGRQIVLRLPGGRYLREPRLDYWPEVEQALPGQILSGYFQSPSYFTHGAEAKMRGALTALSAELGVASSDQVFMHMRRGDYLLTRHQGYHGLASLDYFDRAARLVRHVQPQSRFRVFSDSPELIPAEFLNYWDAELDREQNELSPLHALLLLASNSGLIMSNSSFSWWAAWLANQRHPDATFIAPRPWLANGYSAHTLLTPNWLTLGA